MIRSLLHEFVDSLIVDLLNQKGVQAASHEISYQIEKICPAKKILKVELCVADFVQKISQEKKDAVDQWKKLKSRNMMKKN